MLNALKRVSPEVNAEISEIFSSLQGEGPYLGAKQIFVRFGRCNMACVYCDEMDKMHAPKFKPHGLEHTLTNILKLEDTVGAHHSVSLTGGEPLLYVRFLEVLAPRLQKAGLKTYLETNGTLPQALKRILPNLDFIAMDWKLASVSGDRSFTKEHEAFLRLSKASNVFVKIVIAGGTNPSEFEAAVQAIQSIHPTVTLILQPESEAVGISLKALQIIKTQFHPYASKLMSDVRVIPQMHKIWGVR